MGGSQSYPGLTEDILEDYTTLTYLSKGEILHLMKKFRSIDPDKVDANYKHRFPKEDIVEKLNVLKNNPFQDRIFRVFSSRRDDCFSFEDLLDLCLCRRSSRIVYLDEDNQITKGDICEILERLTYNSPNRLDSLTADDKDKISDIVLEEMKLDHSGGIGQSEFRLIISRIPEFESSFYFKL